MLERNIAQSATLREYMWLSNVAAGTPKIPIGYEVRHNKSSCEILINNFGSLDAPNWRYSIFHEGCLTCVNSHFPSAGAAHIHALNWLDRTKTTPELRLFEWHNGHYAFTVDGLPGFQAIIVETIPGVWAMNIVMEDGSTVWLDDPSWACPNDALCL